jgi:hypothetical protein
MNRIKLTARIGATGLGLVLLTSCAGTPDLDAGRAGELQARVATAKQLTSRQEFPAALAELQQLGKDVATAAEQGLMSEERRVRAEAAISKIRAELEAAQRAAEPQPAPSAEPTAGDHQDEDGEKQPEDSKKEAEKGKGKGDG